MGLTPYLACWLIMLDFYLPWTHLAEGGVVRGGVFVFCTPQRLRVSFCSKYVAMVIMGHVCDSTINCSRIGWRKLHPKLKGSKFSTLSLLRAALTRQSSVRHCTASYSFLFPPPPPPSGGRISSKDLIEAVGSLVSANLSCYVCGPPPMTEAIMDTLLRHCGLQERQIHYERWW